MKYRNERDGDHWYETVAVPGHKLKHCPFCGGEAQLLKVPCNPDSGPGMGFPTYECRCIKCEAQGPAAEAFHENEAVDGWNKRKP